LVWEIYYSNGRLPGTANNKGSFLWREVMKQLDKFKGIAKTDLNDGKTCLFWQDIWGQDCIPQLAYPELFSFAKNKAISVAEAKSLGNFHDLFHLPLSEEA